MAPTTIKNIRQDLYQLLSDSLDRTDFQVEYELDDVDTYKEKIFHLADSFDTFAIYNNNYPGKHLCEHFIVALGVEKELKLRGTSNAWKELKSFTDENKGEWIAGAFSYDLKNDIESISSSNEDSIDFPELHFFVPSVLIYFREDTVRIKSSSTDSIQIHKSILRQEIFEVGEEIELENIEKRRDRLNYISTVESLLNEINLGNIYEINFCRELLAEVHIDPALTARALAKNSPAPFSVFYKVDKKYLICASPERFLMKNGSTMISQPIKGTRRRGLDSREDEIQKSELLNDEKERSENVMIVDLVRNDLSKTATRGSVQVDELFGIYSFPHVHQMISTISSELKEDVHFVDAIRDCFPMGSMTGAPKLRAMKLIEEHELFKRGLFSGSLGLITPEQNFDFNVVIRSILFNEESGKLSIRTGSAITALCSAEKEWEECEIKAAALLKALRLKK